MALTNSQKKYIKKYIKNQTVKQISAKLKITEEAINGYLKNRWGEDKFNKKLVSGSNSSSGSILNIKLHFYNNWKIFLFLALLVFAVYSNSLGNDFVSDDITAIKESPNIDNFSYIIPLDLRTFVLYFIHKLFGFVPAFYRLSNILPHLGSSWMIYILLTFFFKSPVPIFTASLFAVHPILSESITWISGGPYANGTFFILLSLITYIYYTKNPKLKISYFLSITFFLTSLLFSNKFFVFPLSIFLYEMITSGVKRNLLRIIPFFSLCILQIIYLMGLLGPRISSLETQNETEGLYNPLIQIPIAISSYLELIFWPQKLTLYHSELQFNQIQFLIKLFLFLVFMCATILSFFKSKKIFFWLTFFFVALLPTLTPLRISWVVAERYVYMGSIGIFVVIAIGLSKIGEITRNQKITYILFALIIVLLGARTIIRNTDWKNQDTLWLATAKVSPSSAQNHNNLGDYYGRHGSLEKSVEEFQIAIKLLPGYADAYHNLANTYHQMGKLDLAIENYQKALLYKPSLWQSSINLGAIYFGQGKFNLAKDVVEQSLKLNPQNVALHVNLAVIYSNIKQPIEAQRELETALKLDPNNQAVLQILNSMKK